MRRFTLVVCALAALVYAVAVTPRPADAVAAPRIASQLCPNVPGTVSVEIQWVPGNEGKQSRQWLDLSLSDNGFAPDTFISVGPLDADRSTFIWSGLLLGRVHFLRINTLNVSGNVSGWDPSGTVSFSTTDCANPVPAEIQGVGQNCQGTTITGTFFWQSAIPSVIPEGQSQWLDLSTQDNGFAPGTFIAAGPIAALRSSFRWQGLLPQRVHYWRVNTWTGAGWSTSKTGRFTTDFVLTAPDGSCSQAHGDPGPDL